MLWCRHGQVPGQSKEAPRKAHRKRRRDVEASCLWLLQVQGLSPPRRHEVSEVAMSVTFFYKASTPCKWCNKPVGVPFSECFTIVKWEPGGGAGAEGEEHLTGPFCCRSCLEAWALSGSSAP